MGRHAVSPHRRVVRHWRPVVIGALAGVVIVAALLAAAWAITARANDLNEALYQQCIRDELQDAVIVAQLRAAKKRARATLPRDSVELYFQLQTLDDGIAALEPPDEQPCQPSEGVGP